jgi:DtxR family transcriptional regulator, Mn-dependent transcriptional regulator
MLSEAVENYIKAIYEMQQVGGRVTTNALAERLAVKPASVTGMLKKLSEERPRLVDYERHRGVSLTPAGKRIALEVIRHHRLIELYLQQALGYAWDEVHDEADKLEHVISEEFEDRIAKMLGNPEFDPHGDPIPAKDGTVRERVTPALTNLQIGQSGRVARVSDGDPALLRYLAELGIIPDATLTVAERGPFGGPLMVRVGETPNAPEHALGKEVTDHVYIEVEEKQR